MTHRSTIHPRPSRDCQLTLHDHCGLLSSLRFTQTRVSSFVLYTPVDFLWRGIFHGPPPAGSMSHIDTIAAVNIMLCLKAKVRPLHMLDPPPGTGVSGN